MRAVLHVAFLPQSCMLCAALPAVCAADGAAPADRARPQGGGLLRAHHRLGHPHQPGAHRVRPAHQDRRSEAAVDARRLRRVVRRDAAASRRGHAARLDATRPLWCGDAEDGDRAGCKGGGAGLTSSLAGWQGRAGPVWCAGRRPEREAAIMMTAARRQRRRRWWVAGASRAGCCSTRRRPEVGPLSGVICPVRVCWHLPLCP